jgi:hypothetical protein
MEILLKETQEIISDNELRQRNPNVSFPTVLSPEILTDFNAVAILEGPQATVTSPYEYSQRSGIEEINGNYFTKYIVGPVFTDNESQTAVEQLANYKSNIDAQQAAAVRQQRDQLLKDSDWTQTKDSPDAVDVLWQPYRQALRDITTQEGFPQNVTFPDKPA